MKLNTLLSSPFLGYVFVSPSFSLAFFFTLVSVVVVVLFGRQSAYAFVTHSVGCDSVRVLQRYTVNSNMVKLLFMVEQLLFYHHKQIENVCSGARAIL